MHSVHIGFAHYPPTQCLGIPYLRVKKQNAKQRTSVMTTFATNTSARPVFGNFFAALSGLVETAVHYYQYRQTIKQLSTLSREELFDLGLTRSSIKSVANQAVYGV
jgi:uncharacterized protein YjiS (DUF1127 family)